MSSFFDTLQSVISSVFKRPREDEQVRDGASPIVSYKRAKADSGEPLGSRSEGLGRLDGASRSMAPNAAASGQTGAGSAAQRAAAPAATSTPPGLDTTPAFRFAPAAPGWGVTPSPSPLRREQRPSAAGAFSRAARGEAVDAQQQQLQQRQGGAATPGAWATPFATQLRRAQDALPSLIRRPALDARTPQQPRTGRHGWTPGAGRASAVPPATTQQQHGAGRYGRPHTAPPAAVGAAHVGAAPGNGTPWAPHPHAHSDWRTPVAAGHGERHGGDHHRQPQQGQAWPAERQQQQPKQQQARPVSGSSRGGGEDQGALEFSAVFAKFTSRPLGTPLPKEVEELQRRIQEREALFNRRKSRIEEALRESRRTEEAYERILHTEAADPSLTPERRAQIQAAMEKIREERASRAAAAAAAVGAGAGASGGLEVSQAAVRTAAAAAAGAAAAAARRARLVSENRRLRAAVEERRPDAASLLAEARRQVEEEEAAKAAAEAAAAAAEAAQEEEEEEEEEEGPAAWEESDEEVEGEVFGGIRLIEDPSGWEPTPQQLQRYKEATSMAGPPSEELVQSKPAPLTRKDFRTLREGEWLNDEVINAYMRLLQDRDTQLRKAGSSAPRCHFFNTFFLTALLNMGAKGPNHGTYSYSNVQKWTRPPRLKANGQLASNIFECDRWVVPVHQGIHWTCAVVDLRRQELIFLDSMNGTNMHAMEGLRRYIADEARDKLKKDMDTSSWPILTPRIRLQKNGVDCGVFASLFASRVALNRGFDFRQPDIRLWARVKVTNELLEQKLMQVEPGPAVR